MHVFGLHIVDAIIVLIYILAMLWVGKALSNRMKDTGDFYLGGRKLGRFYQFFMNFGNSTNADQAVAVSREIYRQGIGGMWIQYLVLFLTPFYWFTAMLFRRVRLVTIGDYFTERFESKFLGGSYAVFTLFMAFIGGGVGYMVAGKTIEALTPKPAAQYTMEERISVEQFEEYQVLKKRFNQGLTQEEEVRYEELNDRYKKGELRSFVSFTNRLLFYFLYGIITAIYTMLGGFVAAAVTDAVQGVLIITFSVILIPVALSRVGGFDGLHATVPDFMFQLFGTVTTSEYAWYTVAAMVIANLVSIVAVAPNMQVAGSARNEWVARFGMIGGMFFKRFIMILWALTGLLAVALYAGKLHDPDLIWGYMTRDLLSIGMIGLMLSGILAANMSTLDTGSVANSALFINNLYKPFVPGKSERHYINVGRVVIAVTLMGGIGAALYIDNLLTLFKYFISIPAIFGASIWLGFIWRRLTRPAVIIQMLASTIIMAVIPNLFMALPWAKTHDAFLQETQRKVTVVRMAALEEDVAAGRAERVGQAIEKRHVIEPAGIFFERVARIDPEDPASPKTGLGRFHAEIWILSWFGIDFANFSKAGLVATRFFFDAMHPFILLFVISYLTRPNRKTSLDIFYAKLHTPVQPSPEEEERALAENARDIEKFEAEKIFPGTNWEILKPGWQDIVGFGGSWLMVGVVILCLYLVVTWH